MIVHTAVGSINFGRASKPHDFKTSVLLLLSFRDVDTGETDRPCRMVINKKVLLNISITVAGWKTTSRKKSGPAGEMNGRDRMRILVLPPPLPLELHQHAMSL